MVTTSRVFGNFSNYGDNVIAEIPIGGINVMVLLHMIQLFSEITQFVNSKDDALDEWIFCLVTKICPQNDF